MENSKNTKLESQNRQVHQRLENLYAFARLYGYIKYFHPSDEASLIDWNAFAVYGIGQIKDAKNSDDLRSKLDDLFSPIAPTIQLALTEDELSAQKTEVPVFTDDLVYTAWQHMGGGLDNFIGSSYRSKRLNFPLEIPTGLHLGGMAISYAESVMGLVEHYHLGKIVGSATAGANGNINQFVVPGGLKLSYTGMRVVKHDGSQHHLVGVQPTIPVERTIAGVRAGRDEVLETAIELILS